MNRLSIYIQLILVPVLASLSAALYAQLPQRLHTDFITTGEHPRLAQEIHYEADSAGRAQVSLYCYKFNSAQDSLLVYRKTDTSLIRFRKGIHSFVLDLDARDPFTFCDPGFRDVLCKVGSLPGGVYRIYLTVADSSGRVEKMFDQVVDSSLGANAALRKEINDILVPPAQKKLLGIGWGSARQSTGKAYGNAERLLQRSRHKLTKLFRRKGLTELSRQEQGRSFTDLYYGAWYVGRYEADLNKPMAVQIARDQAQLQQNLPTLTGTDATAGRFTVFSQVRNILKEEKEKAELTGEIALSNYVSNGQQEYAATDNNYTEVHGLLEVPVMGIPVGIEGYYTTQDHNRKVKGSYIRFHYDAARAKDELATLITGYKDQYTRMTGRAGSMEMVYQSYLSRLQTQKTKALSDLKKETGLKDISAVPDTAALRQQITDRLMRSADSLAAGNDTTGTDSTGQRLRAQRLLQAQDSAGQVYARAMKRYRQIQELEQELYKYNHLFEQYRNTNYFDSARVYGKIKDMDHLEDMSYKQMAKKASGLLPEGKTKQFITGVTSFDAGMFPQYTSRYTMAGQQLKGLDLGYDLGFCEAGFTLGNTEYVGRDGTVDKYTSYGVRSGFKLAARQKLGLVYYGYMPSRKMLADEQFFKNVDMALPGFRNPVHIVSMTYDGQVTRNIQITGEAATSYKNNNSSEYHRSSVADRMAYNLGVEGAIPATTLTVAANYEHTGKYFENSSLPVSLSGTDLYRVKTSGIFLNSFLLLGVEYNYRIQSSFAATAYNTRWGFDIKTNSKRYPTVALSYKPYSTFRSYFDTLAIRQRPMTGDVWSGRVSYQFKKQGRVFRLMLVYNKNNSESDSLKYGSDMLQLNGIYTYQKWNLSLTAGNMTLSGNQLPAVTMANTRTQLLGLNAAYQLSSQLSLTAGLETGFSRSHISKYGGMAGTGYRFGKLPMMVRCSVRYTSYQLQETTGWQQFYAGTLDLIWQIKAKIFK